MAAQNKLEYIIIARIVGEFGLKGEAKAEILTDYPERFKALKRIHLGGGADGADDRYSIAVQGARLHTVKQQVLLKLKGIDTPEAAAKLRGLWVQVPLDEAWPLEEDSYYEFQLLGLAVRTNDERELGTVRQILYLGSNDVYVVKADSPTAKEYLIPAIKDVVKEINIEAGYILIQPIEGLLD